MIRPLSFLLFLLLVTVVRAQINVKLSTAQEQFLPAEELEVAVKISNFTGGPLRLGTHRQWISFTIERSGGGVVNKLGDIPDAGEFTLQQSTGGTIRFDLAPLFALESSGSYRATATVTPAINGPSYVSEPLSFDIISGTRINEDRPFGFTRADGTVEQRKYILQQANFLKHLRLYLRITDPSEGHTFKVISLGSLVTFNPPQFVLDRQSHLHVLHQFGATEHLYHHFDPDGHIIARQTWVETSRRPKLRVNESGEAAVIGGARRYDRTDVPAPTEAELAAAIPAARTPVSAPTNAPPKEKKNGR
jgi:hypothetical protein